MRVLRVLGGAFKRTGYLCRAAASAVLLGIIETMSSRRGRMVLGLLALVGLGVAVTLSRPVRTIEPGEVGLRVNRVTGGVSQLHEGWALVLPGVHQLRRYPLRDQIYQPAGSARSKGRSPFQSVEGLSVGVEVTVRYALDPERVERVARALPEDVSTQLIRPVIDGVLHRTFARHTVREIFSGKRAEIERHVRGELTALLGKDGVTVKDVFLGNVDLPAEYRRGLEGLLGEGLRAEKMRYTLELKQKQLKQTEIEALGEKLKREKAAEAAGQEQIIAARARAEAMKHVLPLKQKEIEQRRLEAEASKVTRLKQAEADAEARRIESRGEADSRRRLADAEAYRLDVTGKAQSAQLARDGVLIAKNPLLIQKTLADKLSDKIQVIIAPPSKDFFGNDLLGLPSTRTAARGDK
ncbi:MAG: prohibitin family protein [Deltaproteobacteria bacterium]|nr:prohibitin family protein [Deltaproteobacteria bacterium]